MKRLIPDTIFTRLFLLVFAAIAVSHTITFALLVGVFGFGDPPREPGEHPPGEPPFMMEQAEHDRIESEHGPRRPSEAELEEMRRFAKQADLDRYPVLFQLGGFAIRPPPDGLWLGFAIQFITLSIAAWFGARILVRPMERIAQAAVRLGENLHNPPMAEIGPAEARQAAQVFNQMQQRVQSHVEERGRFLAAVSHDLRTPLTRMKLRVERMQEETVKEKLRMDIGEMSSMLDATLEYFRGSASTESRQVLDVQALIYSMVEDAQENSYAVSVCGNAAPLLTEPMSLRRCLSNLVDNALRYGQAARLSLIDSADMLVIEIRDDGPGIPEEMMEAVFEPFVRLESSRNKAYGGVGLGLSIAREAAGRCGGKLTLRNADGGGLIAGISIPRF